MSAHVGRDVLVEFAIADENALEGSLTWLTLGMVRGKAINTTWDTADSTADKSADFTKTALVTFKNVEFSADGVSYDDEVFNQETLEAHVVSPSGAGAQPKAWFRLTYPSGKKYTGPFIVTSWGNESPYDNVTTWSIAAMSNGEVVLALGA